VVQPFHRRYAVWIASVTCVLVAAVMLAAGAVYMANKPAFPRATATILVSLDGVRPEYLGRGHTPTLASLGTRASPGYAAACLGMALITRPHTSLPRPPRPQPRGAFGPRP